MHQGYQTDTKEKTEKKEGPHTHLCEDKGHEMYRGQLTKQVTEEGVPKCNTRVKRSLKEC